MRPGSALLLACLATSPALAQTEVVTRPASAPGPLDNPLKGWCPYTDAGPIGQPYSMVYSYASWKELEPEEGRFAFDRWDAKAWSRPEANGKHVVFRVFVDYPRRPSGLPDWLKAKGVKQTPYKDHGGGLSPDYDDPKMLAAMVRLIEALGRRYDADPRVGFIQLGLLGFWGEWHTYPQGKLAPSKETERQVIAAYHRAFPRKILLARSPRDAAGSQAWLGYHDDMFPEDTENGQDWSFLATLRASGRDQNWKVAAIGGEMAPGQARKWLGDGEKQTTAMVEKAHFSWVGPYCPALETRSSPEFRARSEALVRRMGYQFRLAEIRHPARLAQGGPLAVAIRGENEGVAPFYYPWPVELALIDEKGMLVERLPVEADVRAWLPGPFDLAARPTPKAPPGRYRLALGIRDPWRDRPAIAFASELPRQDGWTILGDLEIAAGP